MLSLKAEPGAVINKDSLFLDMMHKIYQSKSWNWKDTNTWKYT